MKNCEILKLRVNEIVELKDTCLFSAQSAEETLKEENDKLCNESHMVKQQYDNNPLHEYDQELISKLTNANNMISSLKEEKLSLEETICTAEQDNENLVIKLKHKTHNHIKEYDMLNQECDALDDACKIACDM